MSKVFRDFDKNYLMKNGSIIGIIGGIIIIVIVLGIIFTFNQESDVVEIEDILNKEIRPVEVPEIQEKLDEIQKIANENEYEQLSREWITSGPFQIDRSKYAIGEKIFIKIGGLELDMLGQIAIMRPLNLTHYTSYITIPFDGSQKSGFNYYLEPQILKSKGVCSVEDITGKWLAVFRGTDYQSIEFEITDKVVPGTNIETVC